jgi:hypothetical protein
MATAIAGYYESAEAEAATTLYYFGDAINRDGLILQFSALLNTNTTVMQSILHSHRYSLKRSLLEL